jgi:CHAD domain-containing protein
MALAQADLAIELLGDDSQQGAARRYSSTRRDESGTARGGAPDERAVHETRKALKRLRALLRLLARELGDETYARESATLREVAAALAGARDAAVMLSTLDDLIRRHPRKLGRRRSVRELRRRLRAERERTQTLTLSDPAEYAAVLGALLAFRRRAAAWSLSERAGIQLVDGELERIYRQGRVRHRRVARRKRDRVTAMHQWRKRVKDLRYAAEMLDHRHRHRGGGRAPDARLRKLARAADELGELLGEEHDLAVFAERLRAGARHEQSQTWRTGKRARKQLLELIAERRSALRKRALRQGKQLYAEQPRRFIRRISAAHAAGSRRPS